MADQHSHKGVRTDNVSARSSESTGVTHKRSDKGASSESSSESSSDESVRTAKDHRSDEGSDEGVSRSLESARVADNPSDEGVSATNVSVKSSESRGSQSAVEINIKTLDSQLHSFHVNKNMLVSVFKEEIAREIGLPVEQQRLIFRGKVLKDEDVLSEYHVENGHTLHLVSRQPSESQSPSSSPTMERSSNSSNTGQDINASGARPRVGQVSHSVVLGTFGVGDLNDGGSPDINRVIGAVLNSFGIGGQTPMGGIGVAQPNMQFSIPVQIAQGNETGVNVGNHGQWGNQSQPGSPSQSMPQGFQIPVGAVPTIAMPIPDSLNTLSEFMNHMEQALSQNGYQPNSNTEGLPTVELPSNARGLPSPAALAVVLRHAQRLLSGPTVDSLSHTSRRLEEEESSNDVAVRTQIQSEAMQSGLAMQHLGALLLELGRTMLTLRIGQSPAESSVNAGPAVYISQSGPNPIMVQPFPLQTNSLFGGHANATQVNTGAFGPIGVGAVPRHLNIHIHAGPRATNNESYQGEHADGNAGVNLQTRGVGDNMRSGNLGFAGQAEGGRPEIRTDTGGTRNSTSSSTRNRSINEMEGSSSSSRGTNISSGIPLGLGPGGLQPKRRHRHTRSETSTNGASSSNPRPNQNLTSAGGQLDPATIMNQVMQHPALLAGASNQSGVGSPDFLRTILGQLTQNPAMMNTINQLAQQMDGNQDLGGGNGDMSNMVQQMMPFVSQALTRGSSSSNLLQQGPPTERELHRRFGTVKSSLSNDRSSDFQMNLENAAQKIDDQYPAPEIFASVVETAAVLHDNVYDTDALAELCADEELAQDFLEMLKRDVSRRLKDGRKR